MIYLVKIGQRFSGIASKEIAFESNQDAQSYLYKLGFFIASKKIHGYYQHQEMKWAMIQPLELIKQTKPEPIKQTK